MRQAAGPPEIAFVYPNYESSIYQGCSYHYGAASAQAALAAQGISSQAVRAGRDRGLAEIVDALLATRAPVVGFTCYDENYYLVSLLARALKERRPGLKVLVGGPTATFSDSYLLDHNPAVDAVLRGEAEATLPGLITALIADDPAWRQTAGITWRDGDGNARNPDAPLVGGGEKGGELDPIPSPYMSGFLPPSEVVTVGLQTSRRCVYHCIFCNFTIISKHRVRYFSVERVLEELSFIADHLRGRLDQPVPVFDDFFSLNLKRLKRILAGMIELGLHRKLRFLCETRADAVDRELFALLREAGCQAINFGLESAVPRVLRNAKKLSFGNRPGLDAEEQFLEKVRQSVAWAREEELGVSVTVILGLPGETPEDGKATIDYVDRLGCDTYGHNFLQVFPGTELFTTHPQWGIRVEPSATGLPYVTFPAYNVADVPFLRSGTIPALWLERNKLLAAFFSGPEAPGSRPPATAIEMSAALDRQALGAWIEPRAEVIADYTGATFASPGEDFRDFVRRGLPIIRATLLEPAGEGAVARDANRGTTQHGNFASRVRPLPFKDFRRAEPPREEDSLNRTLFVLGIDDGADLAAFGRELEALAERRSYTLPLSWLNRNVVLRDACRWSIAPCAERGPDRRWLLRGSEARPCFQGGAVGTLAEGPARCRERLVALGAAAEAARGCDACAERETCSRCPFPFPFQTASDYCDFRRQHALAPLFVDLLRVKNAFLRSRTRLVDETKSAGQSCRIKVDLAWPRSLLFGAEGFRTAGETPWEDRLAASPYATRAFLLSLPDRAYLVLRDDLTTVELSPPLAEIWEALCMRVHPEDMERYFRTRYGLPPGGWEENLEIALGLFDDLGFFSPAAPPLGAGGEARESFFLRNTLI
jgi:radical SAM superfamily enzyme YgiQ (UPF0313 family)